MKKIRGLSLFANVGIAEAYFEQIGIDVVLANEIDPKRAKFYTEIYPHTEMICGDIIIDEIRNNIIEKSIDRKVDFIIATPPCQGMSIAGNRNEFDDRNQLIYYAIDVIKKVKPKYLLLENVPNLLKTKIVICGTVISISDYIHQELEPYYKFNNESLIKAMEHGVPQMRERNIFILVRRDIAIEWTFPEKQEVITLRDAIGDLPSVDPLLREGLEFTLQIFPDFMQKKEKSEKFSKWHKPPLHSWKQVQWMAHTPSGKSAIYNDVFFPKKDDGSRVVAHHNHYRRMNWDKPSRTITQNNGVISSLCCVHPGREYIGKNNTLMYSDPRVLTIYELLIVSTIPTDWNIPTWANESFIRKVVGEGIPSLLVKNIMLELLKNI